MRVRELSSELGISNKELLNLLRKHNIQVKSHMSGLNEEQVELVRQSLRSNREEVTQKTVTPSGVIVRRRKQPRRTEAEAETAESQEPETAERPAAEEPEPVESTAADEEPAEAAEEEPQTTEGAAAEGTSTAASEPAAEEDLETPDQAETEQVETTEEAEPEQEPSEAGQEQTEAEQQPEAPKRKRSGKGRKKAPEPPRVTVISRPEPEAAPAEDTSAAMPAGEAKPAAEEAKTDKAGKKKKKKDKRTVDVSGLYEEQEQRKTKVDLKKKKGADARDKTGGKKGGRKRAGGPSEQPQAGAAGVTQPVKAAKRKIRMEEAIRVADLAQEMGIKAQDIIKSLLQLGVMATINQSLDVDTATLVASEFGYEVEKVGFAEEDFILPQKQDQEEELQFRPPVVTIMGHVDHGKTSLLDGIRKSHIATSEAGGITQHIGAYHVEIENGSVVFLDTPGHEAFTEMRSRGAQVTDIVILIVAADDGVMDQTKEAINHAKAAEVPIIVAVNKVDKDNADPERVRREVSEHGLIPEEWGGETIFVEISAKQQLGIENLLEMLVLQSEVLELKANPNKRARGHIVEGRLDKGRGPVGTVLIQEGTMHVGDAFVCGLFHGKARALLNDRGEKIDSAGPSMPVEIQGFEGVPTSGDEFVVVENDKVAKRIAETRQTKQREKELAKESKVTLESFFAAKAEEDVKSLNLLLKADVHGSLEAITEAVQKLSTAAVKVEIIHGGIGAISESDVKLAAASSAVIIGFNVRPTSKVKDLAEQEGVDIRFYNVIYQLVSDVKEAMAGMLEPVTREVYLGQAEVRDTFTVPKAGTVAGCFVLDGKLKRNAGVRLLRDGVVQYTGKLSSLKRFKDDVKEIGKDYECGAGLENFNDVKVGDIIEAFEEVKEKATLE
jgi:translation initiation factor IF-2